MKSINTTKYILYFGQMKIDFLLQIYTLESEKCFTISEKGIV